MNDGKISKSVIQSTQHLLFLHIYHHSDYPLSPLVVIIASNYPPLNSMKEYSSSSSSYSLFLSISYPHFTLLLTLHYFNIDFTCEHEHHFLLEATCDSRINGHTIITLLVHFSLRILCVIVLLSIFSQSAITTVIQYYK